MLSTAYMIFEENETIENVGEKAGYMFSYLIFTTILFFILTLLNKIPESWSYISIMIIAMLFILVSMVIKRFLK